MGRGRRLAGAVTAVCGVNAQGLIDLFAGEVPGMVCDVVHDVAQKLDVGFQFRIVEVGIVTPFTHGLNLEGLS